MSKSQREISKTWQVTPRAGMGPHLQVGQVLPPGNWEEFDPFLMLAEDWFQQGTFDFHPHRGIETVTYIIDGKLKHEDNHGGSGVLEPGDVQWMTAGKGIIHSEDPLPGETVHSLQLWVNLKKEDKMVAPFYQDIKDVQIRREEGVQVRVFSGQSGEVQAATKNNTPVTYLEINLEPGAAFKQQLPGNYNGFIYVLQGDGQFGENETPGMQNEVLWLSKPSEVNESEVTIHAGNSGLKCLLIAGEPIGEPVVARGPFVMNTEDEIRQAIMDYQLGKF